MIMKLKSLFMVLGLMVSIVQAQNLSIGSPIIEESAILKLNSSEKGMLAPRLTTSERDAISNPEESLVIFNTDINCLEMFSEGIWNSICACNSYAGTANVNPSSVDFCNGDIVELEIDSANGSIQWQQEIFDGKFYNIEDANQKIYQVKSISCNVSYRAKVQDGSCEPKYSNILSTNSPSIQQWQLLSACPITQVVSPVFTLNEKAYVLDLTDPVSVYEYDPLTDVWTKLGDGPDGLVPIRAFSLNNKAFVMTNTNVWSFDPYTNIWVEKGTIPAFSTTNFGFFTINNVAYFVDKGKVHAYYPTSDYWIKLPNMPFTGPTYLVDRGGRGVQHGNKAYVLFAHGNPGQENFWEYNQETLEWTQLTPPVTNSGAHANPIAFNLCGKLYFGGYGQQLGTNRFFKYNIATDSWSSMPDIPYTKSQSWGHIWFQINDIGYNGSGGNSTVTDEFFKFCP
ncbi:MAG: N-acetylneuraminic acid mutarotase [Sphingobacteriales bacterium]|jgi:N-acetylneuraminic acid mutarotase